MKYLYPIKYEKSIQNYSKEFHVDPYLVAAVIRVESRFVFDVVSQKGARGLMQLMPDTAQWVSKNLNLEDFEDSQLDIPDLNIKMGTWYLANLLKEFDGDIILALAAYNGGRGNVRKWMDDGCFNEGREDKIPFNETKIFVKKVKKAYNWYKRLYKL